MNLMDISILKIDEKLVELQRKIDQLSEFEKQKAELEKVKAVLMKYLELKDMLNSPLATDQSKKTYQFMTDHPYLSLYKGQAGIDVFCSSYSDEKSLNRYAKENESALKRGEWAEKMEKLLEGFKKKSPKV
ncbi:MAG: hypothetical protein Q8R31_06700 [Candidatus Omnitrophota bacterium]|nr:hypothetical protein [Candidatus Omnitrophota bacterium]